MVKWNHRGISPAMSRNIIFLSVPSADSVVKNFVSSANLRIYEAIPVSTYGQKVLWLGGVVLKLLAQCLNKRSRK